MVVALETDTPSRASAISQDPPTSQPSSPTVVAGGDSSLPDPFPLGLPSQSEPAKHVAFTDIEHPPNGVSQSTSLTVEPTSSGFDKPKYTPLIPPHSRSTARPTLFVKTPNHQNGTTFAGSVASLLNSLGPRPPSPVEDGSPTARRRRRSSGVVGANTDVYPPGLRSRADSSGIQSQASIDSVPTRNSRQSKSEPYFLRQYKAPVNPRDHAILEAIYTEMLSSRFINMTPLSILQNYLEYHFSGVFVFSFIE